MEAFPFTVYEWATLSDAVLLVVNAGLAKDATLRAYYLVGLVDVLDSLRARHGNHPVLLETEGDFTEDDGERIALYQEAVGTASVHGLPTLSIRLSLAEVLLELGRPLEAAEELWACESELTGGDESEQASWSELAEKARHAESGPSPNRGYT